MKIHHLAIAVADLGRAEAFYAGVLGLPVIRRFDDDAGAPRSFWLGLDGDAFLAVEKTAAPAPLLCVALAIDRDARDAWRARLAAAGFPVEGESAYTLYVRDPDGNRVGLSHWPHGV